MVFIKGISHAVTNISETSGMVNAESIPVIGPLYSIISPTIVDAEIEIKFGVIGTYNNFIKYPLKSSIFVSIILLPFISRNPFITGNLLFSPPAKIRASIPYNLYNLYN